MALKHLIWAGASAYTAYHLVRNGKELAQLFKDSQLTVEEAGESWRTIQQNLDSIQQQVPALKKAGADLRYRVKLFQKETEAHLAQIPFLQTKDSEHKPKP